MASPAAAGELERQQRQHRADRRKLAGGRPAGRVDESGQIERDQLRDQQEQAGVLGLDRALSRPVLVCEDAHLLRRQPFGRRLGLVLTELGHPREPLRAQDLPHRRARQRRPRPCKLADDLLDPVPGATQLERPLAGGILLGLTLGPRPRGLEQLSHIRLAVLRDQRLHARLRITKPLGDLRR